MITKPLTPQETILVKEYLKSSNQALSARLAGLPVTAFKLPHVAEAIDSSRRELQKSNNYDADQCMKEAKRAMAFAHRTNNANAYVKAVELRAKVMGLLQDKALSAALGMFQIVVSGVRSHGLPPPTSEREALPSHHGEFPNATHLQQLPPPPPDIVDIIKEESTKTDLELFLEEVNDPGSPNPKPLPGSKPPKAFEEDAPETNLTIEDLL